MSTSSSGKRRRGRRDTVSWRDLFLVGGPTALVVLAAIWMGVRFVQPAPPSKIYLIGGAEGSTYLTTAQKYKAIIERFGVKVELVPSRGSLDNLQILAAGKIRADVGFVQGGLTDGVDTSHLMSLGSVFAQGLMVFYRGPQTVDMLSQLKGKRLAVGLEGSGTRALVMKLLKESGIEGPPTSLLAVGGEDAAQQLLAGTVDAAFLMGDSATPKVMRSLREVPGIGLMDFRQAEAYVRKFRFLSLQTLPEGVYDLGKNYPPSTVHLVAPTVELVARDHLHPALSDMLIGAARQVHGKPGLFRNPGEYPAPVERDFPISPDAERFYKSGGQFLYKHLPFWMASLVDRLLVLVLPLLVIIVPATRVVPTLYRWRVRSRIYRWYGALMAIEREMLKQPTPEQQAEITARLDRIEDAVSQLKTPPSFADQLYILRGHVGMVRKRLIEHVPG